MRSLFFLGFGLLPLWAAIGLVVYGYKTMSPENAGMLLWAFLPAIPLSIVTTVIAHVTAAIYTHVKGSNTKRLGLALSFFTAAVVTLSLLITNRLLHRQ